MHILAIEDEPKVLRGLKSGLELEGYQVTAVETGDAGYREASTGSFDCMILDLMLPGRDGLELLTTLRQSGHAVPVIILTARDAIEDRVRGLDAGADDYLIKPFAFAELVARLRALLRRNQKPQETILRVNDLEMDLIHRQVRRGETEIILTPREFDLLRYFLDHQGMAVTREMLGRDVWNDPEVTQTNVIDVHVSSLRRKVENGSPSLIHTIRGIGYLLREESCD